MCDTLLATLTVATHTYPEPRPRESPPPTTYHRLHTLPQRSCKDVYAVHLHHHSCRSNWLVHSVDQSTTTSRHFENTTLWVITIITNTIPGVWGVVCLQPILRRKSNIELDQIIRISNIVRWKILYKYTVDLGASIWWLPWVFNSF